MRSLSLFSLSFFLFSYMAFSAETNFHSFKVNTIDGKEKSLSDYKGKVVLVVNVASKCGLTPQYDGLQKLYEKYQSKGFEIVAFPANNFGKQEPGSNLEIKKFCKDKYRVTFNMMSKIDVKGSNTHDLYKYLIENTSKKDIEWNFVKFLIGPDGNIISRYKQNTKPSDKKLVDTIKKELSKLK
ncbi:MAG: glutathione peroxidase [Lentisphaeraceae bacterium]|nr:glutathione peroxidase [Lentisphaeraceae bacterium]